MPKILGSSDLIHIGEKIRDKRSNLDWTQTDLAYEAGLTSNTVSLIEGSQTDPKLTTFLAIVKALGGSVDSFLPSTYCQEPVISVFSALDEKFTQLSPDNQKMVLNSISAMIDGLLSQQLAKAQKL